MSLKCEPTSERIVRGKLLTTHTPTSQPQTPRPDPPHTKTTTRSEEPISEQRDMATRAFTMPCEKPIRAPLFLITSSEHSPGYGGVDGNGLVTSRLSLSLPIPVQNSNAITTCLPTGARNGQFLDSATWPLGPPSPSGKPQPETLSPKLLVEPMWEDRS